jgi:hypothetical protein
MSLVHELLGYVATLSTSDICKRCWVGFEATDEIMT